jgi:histidine triad (HIT) family protein
MSFQVPEEKECPFCGYLSGAASCAFVTRSELVSAFLNPAQFERGATLVIPNTHVGSLLDVERHVLSAVYHECQRLAGAMAKAFGAVGLNVFQNNGVTAGQTVSHYHVHLVPRYESSVPGRLFRAAEYPRTPLPELLRVAAELKEAIAGAG